MQAYDIFMLTVLAAATAWGAWKGLAWQIASIASLGLSYFVSVNFRGPVSQMFHYDPPEWNNFLAMLVLYLGTSVVVWVGFSTVRSFLERVQLKEFDRQVGGLAGAGKGVLLCTLITMFTMGLGTDTQRQAVITSRSGYYIARLLERVEPMLPAEYRPQLEQTIAQIEQNHGVAPGVYQQGMQLPFGWGTSRNTSTFSNAASWTQQPAGGGWAQPANQNWNQNSGGASNWITPENIDRFQQQVLPRIEQEQTRLQQEINRFNPPPTGR